MRVTNKKFMDSKFGFTLVEIMIVVAIVLILASIAFPSFKRVNDYSKYTYAKKRIMVLADAVEQYSAVKGYYPSNMLSLTSENPPYVPIGFAGCVSGGPIYYDNHIGYRCSFDLGTAPGGYLYAFFATDEPYIDPSSYIYSYGLFNYAPSDGGQIKFRKQFDRFGSAAW